MSKSLVEEEKNLGEFLDFCGRYFLRPLLNWAFGTTTESNAAVTLQFEHLSVNNYDVDMFLIKKKYIILKYWNVDKGRGEGGSDNVDKDFCMF